MPDFLPVDSLEEQHLFYLRQLSPRAGELVLDAGSGRGATLELAFSRGFGDATWFALDNRPQTMQSLAKASPLNLRLTTADVRWLPYAEGTFDAVFSRDILECLPEPLEGIHEMARVLRPGGRLVVCHWDWLSQEFRVGGRPVGRRLCHSYAHTQQGWMETLDPALGRKLLTLLGKDPSLTIQASGVLQLRESDWIEGRFGWEQSFSILDLLSERGAISDSAAARFTHALQSGQKEDSYTYSIDHYWVAARKA